MHHLFRYLLILPFLISHSSLAQSENVIVVEGIILNERTLDPIPYANIGILNTEVGTLSNEDGSFSIKIPKRYDQKYLIFSSIGFQKITIDVGSINESEPLEVVLKEVTIKLDEVTITAKKFKKEQKVFGNGKSLLLNGFHRGDTLYSGSAVALLIDKSQYPDLTYVKSASLYIAINKMPSFKVRMRLLAVDSTNESKPGDDILFEQVVVVSSIRKGWLKFPLEKIHQIEDDFFYLTFEWIVDKEDRKRSYEIYKKYFEENPDKIRYDTVMVEGKPVVTRMLPKVLTDTFFGITSTYKDRINFVCYSRDHSFDTWRRLGDILSAKIAFSNYPLSSEDLEENLQPLTFTDSITQWAKSFQEDQNIAGLQLAVLKDDSLVYSNSLGYADKTDRIKAQETTQFRIASVAKTMTSAGVMKLVSEGKLDLDKTVRHYFPAFPEKKYPITIRQLLSHLGGMRDYYGVSWEDELFIQKHFENAIEAVSLFSKDSLVAPPGTQFVYSSFGYNLLGALIEKVTDQSYLDYMSENIWNPLKMNFTYGDIRDSTMIHKSSFYYYSGEAAKPYDLSYKYPAGGLVSTAEDLVRFGSAVLNEEVLDNSFLEQVFEVQYTTSGDPTGYGLGWYIGEDYTGTDVWYHAGESPESGSILLMYPEHNLIIALLSNTPILSDTEDGFSEEVQTLGKMIYGQAGS